MTLGHGPALTALIASVDRDADDDIDERIIVARLDAARCRGRRAIRSLLHQRLTHLQVELIERPEVRRAVMVFTVSDDDARDSVYWATHAAAESVLRRLEMLRGSAFGLTVVLDIGAATNEAVRDLTRTGWGGVPEGAAVIPWEEARATGIRAAVYAQLV